MVEKTSDMFASIKAFITTEGSAIELLSGYFCRGQAFQNLVRVLRFSCYINGAPRPMG
jgi:hypothetical protein